MKDNKLPLSEIILLVAGLTALIAVQLIFQRPPFYDEDDYLGNVVLLHQYGFGKSYLINLAGSAGPLYSMVHFLFEPLTHLQAPYVRWVNIGFLTGTTYLIYTTLCLLHFPYRFYSFYIMAVPMTYVIGGLALTEMPALFFFSASMYVIIRSASAASFSGTVIQLIIAGCCMSLAIVGRQPYLLTLAALPILFITKEQNKKNILLLGITIFFSVLLPCYVFAIWKGFVPTIESRLYKDIAEAGILYRPDFFLLCIFYFAISMLLTAPWFYRLPAGRTAFLSWVAGGIFVAGANFIFQWVYLFPMRSISQQIFITALQVKIFSSVCGSAVIMLSLYFLVCVYRQLRNLHYRKELVFFAAALLLIAVSCTKITWGFSSRYAAQAIPLLILFGSFFYRPSKYNIAGILAGILIGLISVISYFAGE